MSLPLVADSGASKPLSVKAAVTGGAAEPGHRVQQGCGLLDLGTLSRLSLQPHHQCPAPLPTTWSVEAGASVCLLRSRYTLVYWEQRGSLLTPRPASAQQGTRTAHRSYRKSETFIPQCGGGRAPWFPEPQDPVCPRCLLLYRVRLWVTKPKTWLVWDTP